MKFGWIFWALIVITACSKNDITLPPDNSDSNLTGTSPIDQPIVKKLEGIYKLGGGQPVLGTDFVCKVSRYKVSFFSNTRGISIILKHGVNTSKGSLEFSGFWRVTEDASQGLVNFTVASNEGATDLLQKGDASGITLKGIFRNAAGDDAAPIVLQFSREFTPFAKSNDFMIFGHHGISTTANPPYSENSLKAARYAEDYGLTGIEYDVRLTKDNVPICVHDPSINIRLTLKGPLAGDYDQYGFDFLRSVVDLKDGQKIPSVREVLNMVIDSTNLRYVWLDIKGNPNVFQYLEPVVRTAYARAALANREVTIFAGLPSSDVISEFKKQPTYSSGKFPLPTLCELSLSDVQTNGSRFYGPRYSEGLLLDELEAAHNIGVRVISWTLNDKNIIKNYLERGKFDGFITDYPAYVVYDFYTMY